MPAGIDEEGPKRSQREANYRPTERYRRCWNCGHFRVPGSCTLVEGTILADYTCDLWAEELGGKKSRTGFRAGRRKYQDEAWSNEGSASEMKPAEPPLPPGSYLCLGCAEEWSFASPSEDLPSCPSCGSLRWLAL
jgi:hypothetical protein